MSALGLVACCTAHVPYLLAEKLLHFVLDLGAEQYPQLISMSVTVEIPECQSLRDDDVKIIVLLTILLTSLTSCIVMKLIAYHLTRKYRLHPKYYDLRNRSHSTEPVKSVILWDKDKNITYVKTRFVIVNELPNETEKRIQKDLPEDELLLVEPHQVTN